MSGYTDFTIPPRLVEFILLGPSDDRRQLQDSPILGDVWIQYGMNPGKHLSLLLTPDLDDHSGLLAKALYDDLTAEWDSELEDRIRELSDKDDDCYADVAILRGLVSTRLTFRQLIRWVLPKTGWWFRRNGKLVLDFIRRKKNVVEAVETVLTEARTWLQGGESRIQHELPPLERFVALAAILTWASEYHIAIESDERKPTTPEEQIRFVLDWIKADDAAEALLEDVRWAQAVANEAAAKEKNSKDEKHTGKPLVHVVSLNRRARLAVAHSVLAVKADAAQSLFNVDCSNITWAILDSGIDGRHSAFLNDEKNSRIKNSYDFSQFSRIVSMNNSKPAVLNRNVKIIQQTRKTQGLMHAPMNDDEIATDLRKLADDAKNLAPINWEIVKRYIEVDPKTPPLTTHGTHVAGILGARKNENPKINSSNGMCPSINLLDLRILGTNLEGTEMAIIAALQFLRYLNERGSMMAVHGANLSLSISHDVRNFACGRTPICDECERLVNSGVVVVAAAGNHGYKNYLTDEGPFANFAAFSITDPGNADSVLTVGSTHRMWPHTYGVSFFSSRGPTGDGRVKPDLVAPGERIHAPMSFAESGEERWGDLDGTSMAAPHVSGAAAMLMARYPELAGQPRRIKQILMDSATDLGRTPTFQGRGMLDVLRAFQSI